MLKEEKEKTETAEDRTRKAEKKVAELLEQQA